MPRDAGGAAGGVSRRVARTALMAAVFVAGFGAGAVQAQDAMRDAPPRDQDGMPRPDGDAGPRHPGSGRPMPWGMRIAMPPDTTHDAVAIVREMADYVGQQQNIRFAYDSDIEVVTPEMEKIQFTSSGTASLSRPDKFRATRTGGYSDVELLSDGENLTVYGKNLQLYAQAPVRAPVEAVVDRLRNEFQLDLPAADLLGNDAFDALMEDVIEARHIGRGVVGGVECEHLAFRNHDTDWQLWVRVGDQPVPCRLVITSKTVGAAPQYTLEFHDWEDGVAFSPGAFTFDPPRGARKVEFAGLPGLDEVPAMEAGPPQRMPPHMMPHGQMRGGQMPMQGRMPMQGGRMPPEMMSPDAMPPMPPDGMAPQPDAMQGDRQ